MNQTLLVTGALALALSAALAQKPIVAEATVKVADLANRQAPPPVQPVSVSATLSDQVPAGMTAPADCKSPWCGTVTLGKTKVAVVVGKSADDADQVDTAYLDFNGDGKLSEDERIAIDVSTQPARGGGTTTRSTPADVEFKIGGSSLVGKFLFMQSGGRDPMVVVQFPSYLEASLQVGGQDRIVVVLDQDLDGRFGSAGDLWLLGKAGDRPASAYALSGLTERRFEDGQLIGLEVDGSKVQLTTAAAKGPDPKDAAAHRVRVEHLWSERFDEEREGFVKQRGMDTSRPLAKKPVEWNYVTFDQALALGKKTGKPVFIDVMAFWCVWCYRMDYYTYPDQEVADLLSNKFVAVKIIQEQAAEGEYDKLMKDKLQASGIPAMGIFDGDGKLLHKIGGWKKPEDFVKELQTVAK